MIFTENEDDLIDSERENVDDPMCKGSYSEWSACTPKCKNSENEKGKRTRSWKYEKGSHKMCSVSALMIRRIFLDLPTEILIFFFYFRVEEVIRRLLKNVKLIGVLLQIRR